MAIGDITINGQAAMQGEGALKFLTAIAATTINPGEPVICPLGAVQAATVLLTNTPVVGTTSIAGIAATTSTQTSALAGEVYVYPVDEKAVLLIAPKVAATFDTQAKYDALVGSRVLLDLTTGVYTILAADNSTYGCVIRPLDILKYPGKVAFSFRAGVSYVA